MATVQDVGSNDRLSFTIFLAIAVHAIIIFGITFSLNKGSKVAPTLNITIATHNAKKAPEKADFLAQHNQEASGTADQIKELTTKKIAAMDDIHIRDINPAAQEKAAEKKVSSQQLITTTRTVKKKAAPQTTDNSEQNQEEKEGEQLDITQLDTAYASLKAKLDQQKQDLANKPRIRRLTSVSTKASHDAAYLNEWAQKVEYVGNKNFPKAALDKKIFGKVLMAVLLKPNGVVEKIEVQRSSGYSILDQAAVQIVRLASPFNPIPKEVRKDNDKLEIIRTWQFEITGFSSSQNE